MDEPVKIDPKVKYDESYDSLEAMGKDTSKAYVIVQADRLGSKLFCVKLEYEHYPPRSGKNKYMDFNIVKWPFDPDNKDANQFTMLWFIIGIPVADLPIAQKVAQETGLKLREGNPVLLGGNTEEQFPLQGITVYTLESNSKSVIYRNDQAETIKQRAAEEAECDRIIKGDEQRIRDELRGKGYQPAQIDRILKMWMSGNETYMEAPEAGVKDGQHKHGNIQ